MNLTVPFPLSFLLGYLYAGVYEPRERLLKSQPALLPLTALFLASPGLLISCYCHTAGDGAQAPRTLRPIRLPLQDPARSARRRPWAVSARAPAVWTCPAGMACYLHTCAPQTLRRAPSWGLDQGDEGLHSWLESGLSTSGPVCVIGCSYETLLFSFARFQLHVPLLPRVTLPPRAGHPAGN